jgi:hypothetical protein
MTESEWTAMRICGIAAAQKQAEKCEEYFSW